MKKQIKLIALIMLSVFTFSAKSQTFKKSDKFVEGTFSFQKKTGTDAQWSVTPTVGYFLTDKFAIGAFGSSIDSTNEKTTKVGVFGRCYFLNGKTTKIYSNLGVSTTTDGSKVFETNLGFGLNQFVTKKLALTVSLVNFVNYTNTPSGNSFTAAFTGVNNPLSTPNFGVLYKF